jgi:nucleolar complex protein 3
MPKVSQGTFALCYPFFCCLQALRSKKETLRLHRLNKPVRLPAKDDDLPSIDSNSEGEEESWSSGIEDLEDEAEERDSIPPVSDSDAEMAYESVPRRRHTSWDSDQDPGVESLPIKLSNGKIQKTGIKFKTSRVEPEESDEEDVPLPKEESMYKVEDFSTGARFGRRSVVDIVNTKSRKARVHAAKEQIANICQEIVSDPENSVRIPRSRRRPSLPVNITVEFAEKVTHVLSTSNHHSNTPKASR